MNPFPEHPTSNQANANGPQHTPLPADVLAAWSEHFGMELGPDSMDLDFTPVRTGLTPYLPHGSLAPPTTPANPHATGEASMTMSFSMSTMQSMAGASMSTTSGATTTTLPGPSTATSATMNPAHLHAGESSVSMASLFLPNHPSQHHHHLAESSLSLGPAAQSMSLSDSSFSLSALAAAMQLDHRPSIDAGLPSLNSQPTTVQQQPQQSLAPLEAALQQFQASQAPAAPAAAPSFHVMESDQSDDDDAMDEDTQTVLTVMPPAPPGTLRREPRRLAHQSSDRLSIRQSFSDLTLAAGLNLSHQPVNSLKETAQGGQQQQQTPLDFNFSSLGTMPPVVTGQQQPPEQQRQQPAPVFQSMVLTPPMRTSSLPTPPTATRTMPPAAALEKPIDTTLAPQAQSQPAVSMGPPTSTQRGSVDMTAQAAAAVPLPPSVNHTPRGSIDGLASLNPPTSNRTSMQSLRSMSSNASLASVSNGVSANSAQQALAKELSSAPAPTTAAGTTGEAMPLPPPPKVTSNDMERAQDDALLRVNFDDITVSELKDLLRQRGRQASGRKAVLAERLKEEIRMVQAKRQAEALGYATPVQSAPSSPMLQPSLYTPGAGLHRSNSGASSLHRSNSQRSTTSALSRSNSTHSIASLRHQASISSLDSVASAGSFAQPLMLGAPAGGFYFANNPYTPAGTPPSMPVSIPGQPFQFAAHPATTAPAPAQPPTGYPILPMASANGYMFAPGMNPAGATSAFNG